MEQATELVLTEHPYAPGDPETEKAGPAPAVWIWDGSVLEIYSWINGGHQRFHRAQSPRIMVEEHKDQFFVTLGYSKGKDELPKSFGVGKVFRQTGFYNYQSVFESAEMEQLNPLLDQIAAGWQTSVRR